jgi:hypothetical protein
VPSGNVALIRLKGESTLSILATLESHVYGIAVVEVPGYISVTHIGVL